MNLINREISWLSFNERVLQEALDDRVPLVERMRFLGIYSNNMDEFYRVRVANLRRMIAVQKKQIEGFKSGPAELYKEIRKIVMRQQDQFEFAYQHILNDLAQHEIYHVDEQTIEQTQLNEVNKFFNDTLKHAIVPIILDKKNTFPRLQDSSIYLAAKLEFKDNRRSKFALIQIPTQEFGRFYRMKQEHQQYFILLDDIIRLNLKNIFSVFELASVEAFTFKFTRDADLNLDDDISVSLIEKVEAGLKQRKQGDPVRFVYDEQMPKDLLDYLLKSLDLKVGVNTIPGGKYHNFKDFMSFPDFGKSNLIFTPEPPVEHPVLGRASSLLQSILKQDVLLHFPYQRFDYVVDVLREAAIDPQVSSIKINVYRVARNSQVMNALLAAVLNGKKVTVVLELQARFDEENNLYWSNRLREHGAKVVYGLQGLKVHSKLLQISRKRERHEDLITYIGSGNFNEKTSRIYGDLALLTGNPSIGREVKKVFRLLENSYDRGVFQHLIVSPFNTRRKFFALIDNEIAQAKKGNPARIKIKFNNLTDKKMVEKLCEASQAGVHIQMIVRGICCLIPGVKGISENIEVISIVDRYLEHARFFIFENGGNPLFYISSADWMERNIDKRIEVGVPIYDESLQRELNLIFDYQQRGNVKSRQIDKLLKNDYRKGSGKLFHAQRELYAYYQARAISPES